MLQLESLLQLDPLLQLDSLLPTKTSLRVIHCASPPSSSTNLKSKKLTALSMRETQRSAKRSGKRLNECFDIRSGKRSGRTLTLEHRGSLQETKFTHFGRPHHALASALVARSLWSTVARVQEDPIRSSTDLQSKQSASELC